MSVQQHNGAVVWSVALHVVVFVGLAVGVDLPDRPRPAGATAPIQGVIVNTAALQRAQAARDAAARAERLRQQRAEQQRRETEQQQKLAEQREQQRVADATRAREQAAQEERDRAAAAKREQERQAQVAREARDKAEREAAARKEREAAAARERAAAEQRRREAELQAAIDLDRERADAEAAGLLDQYLALLEDAIKDEWNRPLSARPGIDCVVQVVQTLTGDVVSAVVQRCNGDEAVRRSIERAVFDASPLPRAPDPSLFQRNINVTFKPDE